MPPLFPVSALFYIKKQLTKVVHICIIGGYGYKSEVDYARCH